MKRHPHFMALGLGILTLAFTSCGSTSTELDQSDISAPSKLMADTIQDRIDQIEYQDGDELLANLTWLSNQGGASLRGLIGALDNPVPKVRANAAWCLGQAGNRKAIPFLQRHATDKNPTVRLEISRQLLFLGDYSQVGELITGLDSDNARVRFLAYEALRSTTGKDYGYDFRVASQEGRADSVAKWTTWWTEQKQSQWFENSSRMAAPGK
jgi:HEAT repeats